MAQYLKYVFPPANTQDLCLSQNTTGAANLIFNGNLTPDNNSGSVNFLNYHYSRQVSFTSGATSNASVTFTIVGTQNGQQVVEMVTGPAAGDSTYSVQIYDIITSISSSIACAGIQVGTGYLGYFQLIEIDQTQLNVNYTLSLGSVSSTNQIPVAIYSTLDDLTQMSNTFTNIITNNIGTLYPIRASAALDDLYILPVSPITSVPIVNQILIALNGTSSTLGNGVTLIFIQNPVLLT